MLIDTHCHLTDNRYEGAKDIIDNLASDNLCAVVTVGYDMPSSIKGASVSKKNKQVYFAAGIHPSDSFGVTAKDYDKIYELSKDEKCVAIGEIGLDYHYDNTDKLTQMRVLERQLELVKKANLPVIIHLRDAYEDMLSIISANFKLLPKGGVMHCFSGSSQMAKRYVDMGFYISFAGPVTFKNAHKTPEVVAAVPRDRLLVETDCPYLTPEPFRGKLNYPKYVHYTAQKIAELWGTDLAEVETVTTANALRLFDKIKL